MGGGSSKAREISRVWVYHSQLYGHNTVVWGGKASRKLMMEDFGGRNGAAIVVAVVVAIVVVSDGRSGCVAEGIR